MTKKELLGKELSNLYAIAKQVNTYFDGSDISFLNEKVKTILSSYAKFSCTSEEQTSQMLRKMEVNPGNTSDSIVNEITENLHDIVKSDHSPTIKNLGYSLSLNRLVAYHRANIENVEHLMANS
ncbi:hypothetical protein [uncultured Kriegella sp.]|uniref:hypothetical protein n=1 Tax=uncultured Kriegella sp. TaxID=1798910 RepID=UPI0030DC1E20|tara:strand:- start:111895 stop:112266 length:372 start_codon:yes stop_codon:yes gene_type:complete